MRVRLILCLSLSLAMLFLTSGCASKKYVNKGFTNVDSRMDGIEGSVEDNQTRINENQRVIKDHEGKLVVLSKETADAMQRIDEVKKLAMGKLLYQVTLDNDAVKFNIDHFELDERGQLILDELVEKLIKDNKNVFIEIQGHTDSSGDEAYNMQLGLKRAESVRLYLAQKGVPLHRISTISFGETKPVEDNSTVEGRRMNRRVVILVLE